MPTRARSTGAAGDGDAGSQTTAAGTTPSADATTAESTAPAAGTDAAAGAETGAADAIDLNDRLPLHQPRAQQCWPFSAACSKRSRTSATR